GTTVMSSVVHRSKVIRTRLVCGLFVTTVSDCQFSFRARLPTVFASPIVVPGTGFIHQVSVADSGLLSPAQCEYPIGSPSPPVFEITKFDALPFLTKSAPNWWRPSEAPAKTNTASLVAGVSLGGIRNQAGRPSRRQIGSTKATVFRIRTTLFRRSAGPRFKRII